MRATLWNECCASFRYYFEDSPEGDAAVANWMGVSQGGKVYLYGNFTLKEADKIIGVYIGQLTRAADVVVMSKGNFVAM